MKSITTSFERYGRTRFVRNGIVVLVYAAFALVLAVGCWESRSAAREPGPAAVSEARPGYCDNRSPTRIVLNLTANPSTSQAVTWRSCGEAKNARAEIASVGGSPDLKTNVKTVLAAAEKVTGGDGNHAFYYSAIFEDLVPGTLYAYRVGADDGLSEWNQFRTAQDAAKPFTFVFLGDVQEEIASMCARVFRAAYTKTPNAGFWLLAGDLVDDGGDDAEWAQFYDALGWIPRMTPMVPLPGNHEYPDRRFVRGEAFRLFPLWRAQFTLPPNGPAGLEETAYYVDYQGVRFVLLNGNEKLKEQAAWLDRVLTENPHPWAIAAIHQPVYPNVRRWWKRPPLKNPLLPILDKHAVDLVLQGHIHNYVRTAKVRHGVRVKEGEKGTVYVISVSGPKRYQYSGHENETVVKMGTDTQLFQVITIDGNSLKFDSYDIQGRPHDSFAIEKTRVSTYSPVTAHPPEFAVR